MRNLVYIEKVHRNGGRIESITTDDPELIGRWLIYTISKLPDYERDEHGSWHVRSFQLDDR